MPGAGLPGPVLSITLDSEANIFVSGVSGETSDAYIRRWDGTSWNDISTTKGGSSGTALIASDSVVQHLLVVPSLDDTDSNTFSSENRILLAAGQLQLDSIGSFSTAIFDGTSWYPHLLTTTATGAAGSIASFFYPANSIDFSRHRRSSFTRASLSSAYAMYNAYTQVIWR